MNKRKPVVGITHADMAVRDSEMRVRTYCTHKYYWAVQRAGATVILLPPVDTESEMNVYFQMIDGLVLPGGEDVDPRFQNEDPSPKLGIVNPFRDAYELAMARLAFAGSVPTLGICRGIQVMAVALGGTLHQDISRLPIIQHSQNSPRWATSHQVRLSKGSRLQTLIKQDTIFTNSFHHQAVHKVPKNLKVTGKTSDGLVEALEAPGENFFVGVQWHPEEMVHCDEAAQRLFEGFVKSLSSQRKNNF